MSCRDKPPFYTAFPNNKNFEAPGLPAQCCNVMLFFCFVLIQCGLLQGVERAAFASMWSCLTFNILCQSCEPRNMQGFRLSIKLIQLQYAAVARISHSVAPVVRCGIFAILRQVCSRQFAEAPPQR